MVIKYLSIYIVKWSDSLDKDYKATLFWYLYCKFLRKFAHCSGVYILDFEKVKAGWIAKGKKFRDLLRTTEKIKPFN